MWLLSYADRVAERAMCFDMLRRDANVLRYFNNFTQTHVVLD